ncbi:hypothetical protein [Actinoallomurus iriomotensis]|uniref:hypothetical protein n=1 Tax=Actinoallomurus iriomotensis TaxID=478107 RepID=UPI00255623B1|nr:hypothetical protein [Actinoallomurus iriomotensis]
MIADIALVVERHPSPTAEAQPLIGLTAAGISPPRPPINHHLALGTEFSIRRAFRQSELAGTLRRSA